MTSNLVNSQIDKPNKKIYTASFESKTFLVVEVTREFVITRVRCIWTFQQF